MLPDEVKQLIGKGAGVRIFEVERELSEGLLTP